MKKLTYWWLFYLLVLSVSQQVFAQSKLPFNLYIDADFTTMKAAADSIKLGVHTALSEHNYQVNGHPIKLITKDHRGNSRRSSKHLKQFLNDQHALAVIGGLHSPPLLTNKAFINQQQILTLVPWAAAGPITRSEQENNWIFRLSIDDSNAGEFIVKQTIEQGFKRPYLLLENTGWGASNLKKMTQSLKQRTLLPIGVKRFNWGINDSQARIILHDIIKAKADVILFVGNAPEGIVFAKELAALKSNIAIRSHWGITGGNFSDKVTHKERSTIDLQFIQTKFSFVSSPQTPLSTQVFQQLTSLSSVTAPSQITAPTGFVHAYDLTQILINAMKKVTFSGNKSADKLALHHALENLDSPVTGLIKRYHRPYQPYSASTPNAHEALTPNDYRMGYYGEDNAIYLIESSD